ncbi:MAG: MogA/MoaB family molybdenum cofactor biosynthesis protein [Candidatus Dormibacteraeota bacterium]|uniref:MogA/MoaB family molybdenum cofactor biosynthesis protein n=1 Tax=Candidatus Dormiibacter inghamiae TaxID=3127013 RepID=A0A934ND58_9BACT|nr:MogA/MoaB family molybdenum cofactor biosynthesis protein [Candidatus Dormibacteraeota bacterium]MBJ7605672.1 MogA/MoaB family molybdenum cofactor biosynthesis protein [Candidatus Dormibacteraeota bacterium]
MRAAVLTVSDRVSAGQMGDSSGPALRELLLHQGYEVGEVETVPDERDQIAGWLRRTAGSHDLLLTTGGTGLAPRDVTPQAVQDAIDYDIPGLGEVMRQRGLAQTPMSSLSRSLAGVLGSTLVLALPGSEAGARGSLEAVLPVLDHALGLLKGENRHS